ncbi:MAG: hypothetical protein ACI8ZB_004788 [Desulforhopalus sp.]|jgi:hypothetical protein
MNSYYFILEVDPQLENPVIAHVSRAVAHIWVLATDIDEARDTALRFLKSERWEVTEEKDAYLLTQELIDGLGTEELANYQEAQLEGIKAKFYYWHRSE